MLANQVGQTLACECNTWPEVFAIVGIMAFSAWMMWMVLK